MSNVVILAFYLHKPCKLHDGDYNKPDKILVCCFLIVWTKPATEKCSPSTKRLVYSNVSCLHAMHRNGLKSIGAIARLFHFCNKAKSFCITKMTCLISLKNWLNAPAYGPSAHAVMPMSGDTSIGNAETYPTAAIYATAPPPTTWIGASRYAKIAAVIWIDASAAGLIGAALQIDATNRHSNRSRFLPNTLP